MMGDLGDPALQARVIEMFQKNRGNFEAMMVQVREMDIRRSFANCPSGDDAMEKADQYALGILGTAWEAIKRMEREEGITRAESYQRFVSAAEMLGINVLVRFQERAPLTKEEAKALIDMVDQISRCGSEAAMLWKLFKQHDCASMEEMARLGDLFNSKQRKAIEKALKEVGAPVIKEAATFAQLPIAARRAFLEAAKHSQVGAGAKRGRWIEPVEQERRKTGIPDRYSEIARSSPPSDEEAESKTPDVPEKQQEIIDRLGGVREGLEEREVHQLRSLGVIKMELLAHLKGIAPAKVRDKQLSLADLGAIDEAALQLARREGAMRHIHAALRETLDPLQLGKVYRFSPELLECLKQAMKKNREITVDFKSKPALVALSTDALAALYEAAQFFKGKLPQGEADWFGTLERHSPQWQTVVSSSSRSGGGEAGDHEEPNVRELVEEARRRRGSTVQPR
jgi:hypothetical protein